MSKRESWNWVPKRETLWLNWVRLPRQMDEFLDEIAIDELRKVEGRSKMIVITVAGSNVFLA